GDITKLQKNENVRGVDCSFPECVFARIPRQLPVKRIATDKASSMKRRELIFLLNLLPYQQETPFRIDRRTTVKYSIILPKCAFARTPRQLLVKG
ncbi:11457_t:CDS:1, partial [Gigaspora rosea]